jgi:Pyruvate/2-oxoacid:ferredoxin oxidoreductase gamma subunit
VEREVILTGIGGQGVQVAARVLAEAANREGRCVMMFGVFQGMIRGGSSESTVVASTEEVVAPPIVPRAWAVLGLHCEGLAALERKLGDGGLVLANAGLLPEPPAWRGVSAVLVPATAIATDLGVPLGASMVMLGAFAASTGFVAPASLAAAMGDVLPAHRRSLLAGNARCLQAGTAWAAEQGLAGRVPHAWNPAVRAATV